MTQKAGCPQSLQVPAISPCPSGPQMGPNWSATLDPMIERTFSLRGPYPVAQITTSEGWQRERETRRFKCGRGFVLLTICFNLFTVSKQYGSRGEFFDFNSLLYLDLSIWDQLWTTDICKNFKWKLNLKLTKNDKLDAQFDTTETETPSETQYDRKVKQKTQKPRLKTSKVVFVPI